MRRIAVVAPDKFKGSLTAREAAASIARGIALGAGDAFDARLIPMADGGEGTVAAFVEGGARRVTCRVRGPLGAPVEAAFALDGTTAIVEMAAASGLATLPAGARDPLRASTYGTGELVRAALDTGARRVIVAVGGSATNDGGAGLLRALGVRFTDAAGGELGDGGAPLGVLAAIDARGLDPRLAHVALEVAADVDNPLLGPRGASAVFGPQKGATPDDVRTLETALARFADMAAQTLGVDRRNEPGVGAAGGLAFGLRAFAGATIRPGVAIVAELRGLPQALAGAALCLTGEGSIDAQTLGGKTVAGVARLARAAGVAAVAFGGRVEPDAERRLAEEGVVAVPIADGPRDERAALRDAASLIERAAARVVRLFVSGDVR